MGSVLSAIMFLIRVVVISLILSFTVLAQNQDITLSNEISTITHNHFEEGNWLLNYGIGYGGVSDLFYAFGFSDDPFQTSHIILHSLLLILAADYFFGHFFDIGVDITLGGNLNRDIPIGGAQIYGGHIRMFTMLVSLRTIVHYPFSRADVYGGLSLGLGLTRQTFYNDSTSELTTDHHLVLGWILRVGSRFHLSQHYGLYVEGSFPLPWISLGGYYSIR